MGGDELTRTHIGKKKKIWQKNEEGGGVVCANYTFLIFLPYSLYKIKLGGQSVIEQFICR